MELIGNLWWLWVCILVCGVGYVWRVQYQKTRILTSVSNHLGHTVTGVLKGDPYMVGESVQRVTNEMASGFFGRFKKLILAGMVAAFSGLLFLISIVVILIDYFAKSF